MDSLHSLGGNFAVKKIKGGKDYVFYLLGDQSTYTYIRTLSAVFAEIGADEFYLDMLLRTGDNAARILHCIRKEGSRYDIHNIASDADIDRAALEVLKERPEARADSSITNYELTVMGERVNDPDGYMQYRPED